MRGNALPSRSSERRSGLTRSAVAVTVALLPVAVFFLDIPPGALAGCGTYGYACAQSACFRAEISTNQGYTWQAGSAWVYGPQGTSIDLYVRTTMSSTVNSIEGWSMGLKHTAPTLIGINGGNLYLKAATSATGSNSVSTLLYGTPPDFLITRAWDCGQTQGVVVDYDATHYTTGPNSGLVTTLACYRLTFPYNSTVHQVTLDFTDDVGYPAVKNVVVRSGQSLVPCKDKLTINVLPTTSYSPTQSYCPYSQMSPYSCESQGGGGGGGLGVSTEILRRGNANSDADINISDPVSILMYLFSGGASPPCPDAADIDDDGDLDLTDGIRLLGFLFLGTAPPPYPGPLTCGTDWTADTLGICVTSAGCQTSSEVTLLEPADGAAGLPIDVMLTIQPLAGPEVLPPVNYTFLVLNELEMAIAARSGAQTQLKWCPGGLAAATTYHWRVLAEDSASPRHVYESETRAFTTGVLPAVTLVEPSDGALDQPLDIALVAERADELVLVHPILYTFVVRSGATGEVVEASKPLEYTVWYPPNVSRDYSSPTSTR